MDSMADVERMLKEYASLKREMRVLSDMIEHFIPVSEMEILESLSFCKPDGARVQNTAVSEKTAKIAAIYRNITKSSNDEALSSMIHEYHGYKSQVDFIDFCLPRIKPAYSQIMIDFIQKELTWAEVCEKYHISNTTIGRYRKAALEEITRLYDLRFRSFSGPRTWIDEHSSNN